MLLRTFTEIESNYIVDGLNGAYYCVVCRTKMALGEVKISLLDVNNKINIKANSRELH